MNGTTLFVKDQYSLVPVFLHFLNFNKNIPSDFNGCFQSEWNINHHRAIFILFNSAQPHSASRSILLFCQSGCFVTVLSYQSHKNYMCIHCCDTANTVIVVPVHPDQMDLLPHMSPYQIVLLVEQCIS